MASITSLMNSNYNTSSIYGSRNVLSGLASGMDTESMIENAVSGIKNKITSLLQKRTKIEWQQDAYRSIIDKAASFNTKYTSYTSKTNLMSNSFFNNAVITTTNGTYADKISASGKSSSEIKINSVKQMAKAATYTVSGSAIGLGSKLAPASAGSAPGILGEQFDLSKDLDVSTISGSLTFKYGGTNGTTFDISFDELEDWDSIEVKDADGNVVEDPSDTQKLAQAIQNKLGEISYSYTKNGFQETTTADKAIKVEVDPVGGITFSDGLGNGNKVTIDSVSGDIEKTLGINKGADGISRTMIEGNGLSKKVPTYEYLAGKKGDDGKWTGGKELNITLNGTTKKINMSDVMNKVNLTYDDPSADSNGKQFADALQNEIDSAFGKGKISVGDSDGRLSLTPAKEGDTLGVGGSAMKALGFEKNSTNYINTSKKLSELMDESVFTDSNKIKAEGEVKLSANGKYSVDSKGNRVSKGDDGEYYRVNSDGEFLYNFKINDANINITKDTTLESLINSINSNADAGVKVSYSKLTNEFKFTASETGANSRIEFSGLAEKMFGSTSSNGADNFADMYGIGAPAGGSKDMKLKVGGYGNFIVSVDSTDTVDDVADKINAFARSLGYEASHDEKTGELVVTDRSSGEKVSLDMTVDGQKVDPPKTKYTYGQDAIMDVEINGKRFENFTRSNNSFDIDGLTVSVKGTFEAKPKEDGGEYEPVTFTTTTDTDKIIDAIRSFVEDYNTMATELKSAYSTLPAQQTNGSRYEPLTAEQENGMTESEIASYNEKAKQGILFGDTTLSSFYGKLLNAIQPGGTDGQTLREIGISTAYSDGMTTLSLDEDKLRTALENDPDKVRNAFTKTREGGSSSDGLMQTMQNTLNNYVKTTGEPKGILITHAGSIKAPTSLNNNSLKTKMDNIDSQITRWQDKMASQIDRYTTKFSRLEQLIAQMNSQYSAMSGLMGGTEGY